MVKQTVVLRGGLGNQMFQAAIGEMLRTEYGSEVQYSLFYIRREPYPETHIFSLKNLNLGGINYLPANTDRVLSYLYRAKRIYTKSNRGKDEKNDLLVSSEVYRYFPKESLVHYRYLDCFFQNYEYFRDFPDELRGNLKVRDNYVPDKKNAQVLQQISHSNAVCVHIRRGDYVSSKWASTLMVCDKQYYDRAIKYMRTVLKSPLFFIFSNTHDDLVWIKENYRYQGPDFIYVDLGNIDYKELYLMYHCRHFILSNSSFSWWAQFLSDEKCKIVVAPVRWTNSGEDCEGIYGSHWVRM